MFYLKLCVGSKVDLVKYRVLEDGDDGSHHLHLSNFKHLRLKPQFNSSTMFHP